MIAAKADANALLAALMSTQACVAAQTPVKSVKSVLTTWRSSTELSKAHYFDSFLNETSAHWDDNMSVHSEDSSGSWETANTEDLCHSELDTDSNYWAQRHRQKQHRQRQREQQQQEQQRQDQQQKQPGAAAPAAAAEALAAAGARSEQQQLEAETATTQAAPAVGCS